MDPQQSSSSSPHRLRVNGSMLPQNHNKAVCVLGTMSVVTPSYFRMKASDGVLVSVQLKSPSSEPNSVHKGVSYGELVEVYGICKGDTFILADSFTRFLKSSISESFDMGAYNEAVKLLNTVKDNVWSGFVLNSANFQEINFNDIFK